MVRAIVVAVCGSGDSGGRSNNDNRNGNVYGGGWVDSGIDSGNDKGSDNGAMDLQGPFCHGFELHHSCPGLMEDLETLDHLDEDKPDEDQNIGVIIVLPLT
ncbi:hypothetical protein PoB_006802900 [Plakobranchus ocellatus]|uniref:Uncharacterized protein n=1 Tax=Plakobranchus ocellatus TaxID=259542 RepID=A0AAV4DBE5_9GAST|nr:hypothetical protein PoB_006802900 [Plakobranchus ocellatus]